MTTENVLPQHVAATDTGKQDSRWLLVFGMLSLLHLLMLGYDAQHPERFLNADRALSRMHVMEEFETVWRSHGDLVGFFIHHGIVGDWLPQALLYLGGGSFGVILVQVLLALLSVVWVRDIALRLKLGAGVASLAALLYGLLPHTLVLPHQLATEAIFDPLLVGSFAFLARATRGQGLTKAGALMGMATLVRPVSLLWPLLCAAWMPFAKRARMAYLGAALGPLLLWMGFIFSATGEFSMGSSDHDLGHNLYLRVERITEYLPQAERPPLPPPTERGHTLGLREYAAFALDHPLATLRHSAQDVLVLSTKSGLERLLLDYLDLVPSQRLALQSSSDGWRNQVERNGWTATLLDLVRRNPVLVVSAAGGALLFCGFILLAILGARHLLSAAGRNGIALETHWQRLLLMAFPFYILLTAQVIDAAQSRHRAPAEFALCLLAAVAIGQWHTARRGRHAT